MKQNITKLVSAVVLSLVVALSTVIASPIPASAGCGGCGGGIGGVLSMQILVK